MQSSATNRIALPACSFFIILSAVSLFANGDENFTLIGRWAEGPCDAVCVAGTIAYFGNGGYLEIVDFSDPAHPVELSRLLTPSIIAGIAVLGNHAYVATVYGGLRIIDVTDPSRPEETGSVE